MPALSPTMEHGTIAKWVVQEGQEFSAGDIICEVETDKATVDFEAQDDAVVAKILVDEGVEIEVGVPIVVLVEDVDSVGAFFDFNASAASPEPAAATAPEPTPAPAPALAPVPAATIQSPSSDGTARVMASPLARKIARESGLDVNAVVGTGPGGRVLRADVESFASAAAASVGAHVPLSSPSPAAAVATATTAPAVGDGFVDYATTEASRAIAAQLTAQKQVVPHYYLTVDLRLDDLLSVRENLNAELPEDESIALNDLLLKAAALAVREVPAVNAAWMDTFVRQFNSVDMSLTMGVGDGLVTPVLRNVGGRGLKALSDDTRTLATEANDGTLLQAATVGGTFTVTNLGMYGVKSASSIITPGQACSLALGAAENRVIPHDDPEADEIYQLATMLTATLSCDHRVIDGAVGAQWLASFKKLVESPVTMLL